MFLVQRCREYRTDLTCDYTFPPGTWERNNLFSRFCVTLVQRNEIWERDCNYSCNIYACESLHLIIYFIYLFINSSRGLDHSQSKLHYEVQKRKKKKKTKIRNTNANKNDNT